MAQTFKHELEGRTPFLLLRSFFFDSELPDEVLAKPLTPLISLRTRPLLHALLAPAFPTHCAPVGYTLEVLREGLRQTGQTHLPWAWRYRRASQSSGSSAPLSRTFRAQGGRLNEDRWL